MISKEELDRKEAEAWKKWNEEQENNSPVCSPAQILSWLDGMREFMFEIWRRNPEQRREYERLREKGF